MRTTIKLVSPLILSVAAVTLFLAAYQARAERRTLRNDLSRRAEVLGESLQETIEPLFARSADRNLQRIVERFGQREHLKGIAVYDENGATVAITPSLARRLQGGLTATRMALQRDAGFGELVGIDGESMYV